MIGTVSKITFFTHYHFSFERRFIIGKVDIFSPFGSHEDYLGTIFQFLSGFVTLHNPRRHHFFTPRIEHIFGQSIAKNVTKIKLHSQDNKN